MAKKKGKREEGFTFPKFDSEEYRVKEVRDSKVTVFAVLYAIVIAVICYSLVRMADMGGSVTLIGFAAPFGLIKILPIFFDTSEFERKNWFGPMMMSFMAWLGFMILLSNPPFNDIAKPKFQQVETYVESDGNWNQTLEIDANTPFVLVISVKDNWEVESVKVSAGKAALNSQTLIKLEGDNEYNIEGNSLYYHFFENGLDTDAYSFIFYAEDAEGNSNSKSISLTIG
jgi:hypothetical protein